MGQLQSIQDDLVELGYQLLAISPDRPEKLSASKAQHKLGYQLLSDSTMACAKAFGLAFQLDEASLERYKGYGIDLEEASGEDHHLLPVPAVYVVGTDGKIRHQYANPDYRVRLDPEVLLAAARAAVDE